MADDQVMMVEREPGPSWARPNWPVSELDDINLGLDPTQATIEAFKKVMPTGLRADVKSVTAEGDRVAVEWEGHATTSEGKAYDNQYCMVFTLRDGRISHVNEYFCTLLADQVLYPLIAEAEQQQKLKSR